MHNERSKEVDTEDRDRAVNRFGMVHNNITHGDGAKGEGNLRGEMDHAEYCLGPERRSPHHRPEPVWPPRGFHVVTHAHAKAKGRLAAAVAKKAEHEPCEGASRVASLECVDHQSFRLHPSYQHLIHSDRKEHGDKTHQRCAALQQHQVSCNAAVRRVPAQCSVLVRYEP
jgi:hypothetical protein